LHSKRGFVYTSIRRKKQGRERSNSLFLLIFIAKRATATPSVQQQWKLQTYKRFLRRTL